MEKIVQISLDNEMDLILAHRRTMKLSELCGLSVSAQTTFATAVSEIARSAISFGKNAYLVLAIAPLRASKKVIIASLYDSIDLSVKSAESISYARKLMGDISFSSSNNIFEIRISHQVNFSGTLTPLKIQSFKEYFKNEPPLSPYDEIRKKNIQLIELSDKLRESEKQYKTLTDTLPLMMFAIGSKSQISYFNKGFQDFSGQTLPGLTSAQIWQGIMHPDDYKAFSREWENAQLNTSVVRVQVRLRQKNKENFLWHLMSVVPLKGEKGNPDSWIGFFVDIQAQKLIEETLKDNSELKGAKKELEMYQAELEQKIRELNTSNNNLEQFAYIASHDLQEPLRKIKTYSTLLKKEIDLTAPQSAYFGKIVSSADRMSNLITDVLNYSRLSVGSEVFVPTDLNDVLKNVLVDFELLIQESKTKVRAGKLPIINGIPLQLSQLFSNIVNNAIKFSKESPVIKISSEELSGKDLPKELLLNANIKYHRICFTDNGIGFEQKFAEQIFTIFQRLNDKAGYAGNGIGLALCKKIVENHHGAISAQSKPGSGTEIFVYLEVIS